jgi:hypothetical protein
VLYVFVPIAIVLAAIFYFQNNSIEFNKKKYEDFREKEFKGKIIKKKQEGDYPRARRYVLLDNYLKEHVDMDTYREVTIGDSVVKRRGEDSVFFYLKSGSIMVEDDARYLRESYKKLMKKNQ